jgi:trk system potassium uptake protein TrkA
MYVLIVGGGKVGYFLSRALIEEGHEVLVLEKEARRYEEISRDLGDVAVLGDGCELRTTHEAGMERADVVVAVTGDDEDNLVVCQMAKSHFKVKRTLARVNNPKNEAIFKQLGVDDTVNSTRVIFSLIQQEVDMGEMIALSPLRRGDIEVVEAELTPHAPATNHAVKDLRLPGDSVLAAIIRGEQILLPSGTTELLEGDEVIALTRPGDAIALRELLTGARAPSQ